MGLNELVVRKPNELVIINEKENYMNGNKFISYALADSSKYKFEYIDDSFVIVDMVESDRKYDSNDFIDADFEEEIEESHKSYYLAAAASGVLTGAFSQLDLSKELLYKISEWKDKDWNKYLIAVAKMVGYNKDDLKGAIKYIKERVVPFIGDNLTDEVRGGIQHVLGLLSSHPSVAGLVFSIFTQFSEDRYYLDEDGLKKEPVPEYYAIGRSTIEKLTYGFLYWVFNLAIDKAISNRNILDDMKIPDEVIRVLKRLYKLPIFSELPHNYEDAEKLFSEWMVNTFENSIFTDEDGEKQEFDYDEIIKNLKDRVLDESLPVILNECFVRVFYLVKKLGNEISDKDIHSFEELNRVDVQNILPFNNRLITRMILISSACFMGTNIAGAVVKAVVKEGDFKEVLLTEINIAGIGRFAFACVADCKYWSEDLKVLFQRREKNKVVNEKEEEKKIINDMMGNDVFKILSLNPLQTRILYSLENLVVLNDIEKTKDDKDKAQKQQWLEYWQERIAQSIGISREEYFTTDEARIYDAFNIYAHDHEIESWFYLMTMELALFKPYHTLGIKEDSVFKKLSLEKYNYVDDQFVRKQTIVNQTEIDNIRDAYKKYKNYVSGGTQNVVVAAGVAAAAAVAVGGAAFVFAPGIAVLLAGEAVAGLHGAALTSAALAAIGGGSLAAGGLGMAGGTAIITGGGALLGIAGSGSASMLAILSQTSSEYWLRQTIKLLVFCKCVLKDRFNDVQSIKGLSSEVTCTIEKIEKNIKELEIENCSLDKEGIKTAKSCVKYLNRCNAELEKMMK